jgi:ABC-type phosphate transport system permease subunit
MNMNKKQEVKEAKEVLFLMKVGIVLLIVFGVFLLILSAWAWGLVTTAKEVPGDIVWEADVIPFTGTAFGCIVLIIGAVLLYPFGKIRKALQGMSTDEADK